MTRYSPYWGVVTLLIFISSLLGTAYFALQLRQNEAPSLAGYLSAEKGYGVTIDLSQYSDADLSDTLQAMQQSGLTWLRQPINWVDIEPEPGHFNWQELDRVMEQVSQSSGNFKLIVVLQTTPAWARADNSTPTTPPTHLSSFGYFTHEFAARYGHTVDYYQIWHEPNLSATWGDIFVDPAAYANLLREATLNIKEADSTSYILTAALAATLEDGPLNLNEIAYLDQLYQAKANRWFDIVALQPYGLWAKPLDPPDPAQLNFRRAELTRQVMLNHNDAQTPVWATGFGWVALPDDWAGRPSPWSNDTPTIQAPRTAKAINHARQQWPWLGPMLATRWDSIGLAADDPAQGFALQKTPTILTVIEKAVAKQTVASVGHYPADHISGNYSPGWRFALTQADIPPQEPRTLTIPFEGTRLDLDIERGLFRGYLWVTIDDQPTNTLPKDETGQSYVVLYDPLRHADSVTLAQHLPAGPHTAEIKAEGGWDQWVLQGWIVQTEASQADTHIYQIGLIIAGLLALFSGLGMGWQSYYYRQTLANMVWAWSEIIISLFAIFGQKGQAIVIFGLAAAIYLWQGMIGLALLPVLALAILIRPDLGLAVITVAIFFFQLPIQFPIGGFSPVELTLALTIIGVIFRGLVDLGRAKYNPTDNPSPFLSLRTFVPLKSTDWAALSLIVLAFIVTLTANNFAVSFREWRIVVVESVLFYFLVRLGLDFSPMRLQTKHTKISQAWAWRLINALVVGATLQAIFALYLYYFTNRSIDAEGVHRALGLGYGSPNNLALVLDRVWPILLTVAILPSQLAKVHRGLYGISLALVSLALYLTFSKGALLIGLPLGFIFIILGYGWHHWRLNWPRGLAIAGAAIAVFVLALIPFSRTQRFQNTFDFSEGSTAFFRIKLWQASGSMLQDHWPLGVGLDNFLYQYRTRYILPEAWQEPNLNHPHNIILDFGTRLGVGGIAILFWLQIAYWRKAWNLYKSQFDPLVLGLMGSMVVFLAHGLVDNSYFLVDLAFIFFLVVGLTQRLTEDPPSSLE